MKYRDYISTAAFRNYNPPPAETHLDEIGFIIQTEWGLLEQDARPRKYDVLENIALIRPRARKLIGLLFCAPGSHPHADALMLLEKDAEYGGSWVKRGGVGAFFTAVRKMDRLNNSIRQYNGFEAALEQDKREEGILDDIGDLRRYLILWEAWWLSL